MKMVMAVINNDDARNLLDRLTRRGFSATVTSSSGGFYRISNTTVFCGVEDEKIEDVLDIIRETCPDRVEYVTPLPPVMEPGEVHIPTPVEKHMGGATVFVLNVDRYEEI